MKGRHLVKYKLSLARIFWTACIFLAFCANVIHAKKLLSFFMALAFYPMIFTFSSVCHYLFLLTSKNQQKKPQEVRTSPDKELQLCNDKRKKNHQRNGKGKNHYSCVISCIEDSQSTVSIRAHRIPMNWTRPYQTLSVLNKNKSNLRLLFFLENCSPLLHV